MRKISTVFEYDELWNMSRTVRDGNEWVLDGEGIATAKYDGTPAMWFGWAGQLMKRRTLSRREVEIGSKPPMWLPAQDGPLDNGKWPGWVPCNPSDPADQYYFEAVETFPLKDLGSASATFELVGPKIEGNPHGFSRHILVPHGGHIVPAVPRDYDGLQEYLSTFELEGIVFFARPEQEGELLRVAKIRRKDFGLPWPIKQEQAA